MNLIDCVKSGKRFKRPHWQSYYRWHCEMRLDETEIVATDWQIEEDPKPKRRLYINQFGEVLIRDISHENWTPLSRKEFEALFEGDE